MTPPRPPMLCAALALASLLTACASGSKFASYDTNAASPQAASPGFFDGAMGGMGGAESKMAEEQDMDYRGGEGDEIVDLATAITQAPKAEPTGAEPTDNGAPDLQPPTERLLIYDAQIGILVFKIDETLDAARAMNEKHGGWIQQSTSASLVIRVPVKNFEALVKELTALGDVSYKNIVGTDVTEEFFDLQIRMKNAMVLRDRFIELLAQSKTVEASLAIEKELSRLTEQIELMKGRIRFLQNHAAFSTITLNVQLKQAVATQGRIGLPFGWLRNYNLNAILH